MYILYFVVKKISGISFLWTLPSSSPCSLPPPSLCYFSDPPVLRLPQLGHLVTWGTFFSHLQLWAWEALLRNSLRGGALLLGWTFIGGFGDLQCVASQNLPSSSTLLLRTALCEWVTSACILRFVKRPVTKVFLQPSMGFFFYYSGRSFVFIGDFWDIKKLHCYADPMLLSMV